MEPIKTTIQVTEKEYMAAIWLAMRLGLKWHLIVWIPIFAFLVYQGHWFLPVFVITFTALWTSLVTRARLKKEFRQQALFQQPMELQFTDSHFTAKAESFFYTLAWKDFLKWRKNPEVILLYQTNRLFNVVPTRAFASDGDLQAVIRLLKEKVRKG
jgi:hypothetical protein